MTPFDNLTERVGKKVEKSMAERTREEVLGLDENRKQRLVKRLARDAVEGLSEPELFRVLWSAPKWVGDILAYFESHLSSGPPQFRRYNIAQKTIKSALHRQSFMDRNWSETQARRVMGATSSRQSQDMPRYENWELPPPTDTLRALEVEAQNKFIELMDSVQENLGTKDMLPYWEDAVEDVVPHAIASNHSRMMELYDQNETIIDYYANVSQVENGLQQFNRRYIQSGLCLYLFDQFEDMVKNVHTGDRSFFVRFRPDGYELESTRPTHPLQQT